MALYFITYDLRKGKDYQKLYDKLNEFNAVRVLESTWCFKRNNTSATSLRDYFKSLIDTDDGLLIDKSETWASYNVENTPNKLK